MSSENRMKKTTLLKILNLIIITLISNCLLFASTKEEKLQKLIDQYKLIIQKNNYEKDANYIMILEKLSAEYEFVNIDSSIYYANKLKDLSSKYNNEKVNMIYLNLQGNINQTLNKNQEALNYYFQAYSIAVSSKNIKYCTKISRAISFSYYYQGNYSEFLKYQNYSLEYAKLLGDRLILGESYTNLGISFGQVGDYKNAILNHSKALEIFTEKNDQDHIASCLNNLGLIYLKLQNYDKALNNFNKSIEIKKKSNSISNLATGGSISGVYGNIGLVYSAMHQAQKALEYYIKSLENVENESNKSNLIKTLNNITWVLIDLKKYDEAQKNLDSSYQIALTIGDVDSQIATKLGQAKLFYILKKYKLAEQVCLEAKDLAIKIKNNIQIIECYNDLYNIYEANKQYQKAFEYLKLYNAENQKNLNEGKIKEIANLEAKYEFEKEKKELINKQKIQNKIANQEIKTQKYIINSIAFALVVFTILILLVLRNSNKVKNINQLLQETNVRMENQNEEIQSQNQEITIQKEELQNLNEIKDKFVSIISHDLRSPFSGFLGMTELLVEHGHKFSKEELLEKFEKLNKSAQNVSSLLENLLELSIIHRGLNKLILSDNSLKSIISINLDLLSFWATKKEITIETNIESDFHVFCDLKLVNSVIRNILSNALKFTNIGGKIKIDVYEFDEQRYAVSISDNGVGMDAKTLNNLFQLDKKTSRLGTEGELSSGLGLIICKEYIENHKCEIYVESQENVGSKFTITLPKSNSSLSDELIDL